MKNDEMPETVKIEIVSGVEGPCLVIDDWRVAGPKPWGGGKVLYSFDVPRKKLPGVATALEEVERLRAMVAELADNMEEVTRAVDGAGIVGFLHLVPMVRRARALLPTASKNLSAVSRRCR